jgi:hypothetical protein
MENYFAGQRSKALKCVMALAIFFLAGFITSQAFAFTLSVLDGKTNQPIAVGYRWLVEEDATHHVIPGNPATNWAVKFHKSYMPVVAQGTKADTPPDPPAGKYYYVSVLPDSGYSIGGASVINGSATVYVQPNPIPTAQITIFVFEDNNPINNAPDLPVEQGLAGFTIVLEDAGGRYGISAGTQSQDAFGNPLGEIKTDANGMARIKNLAPGKYGISVVPPAGQGWQQTSTIEGTKIIDAWVKANEPPYFQEFGPPGPHVSIGFVRPFADATVLTGGSSITGQVVNLHLSRPPDYAFYNGAPFEHTTPWVGLNFGVAGRGIYAQRCNADGTFNIPNVPPGTYQLVIWDDNLDLIFAFHNVTVPAGGAPVDLGDVPVHQWFTRLKHFVFNDLNGNGYWDDGEPPLANQNINLRWRDGTVYQAVATAGEGDAPFDEVFPFFSWQVAEVDYARLKATGVTVVVDAGGSIDSTDPWTFGGQLNPQLQPDNGNNPYRTETGPVLLQGFQGFIGQTSVMMWGKQAYGPGENGGISGIVYYSTTRAEDDPRYGFAEPWEPGIPDVRVNLYDSTGTVLLNSVFTDNWDANADQLSLGIGPNNCPGSPDMINPYPPPDTILDPFYDYTANGIPDCYDGMRVWNQVRPAVFDGGYAFTTCFKWVPGGPCVASDTPGAIEEALPAGKYVVEVVPPAGYRVVGYEDKNVDFGDSYTPSLLALPPLCVGSQYTAINPVPAQLSLFPGVDVNPLYAGKSGADVPSCDRKEVILSNGANAAADFFLFTHVPIAGHIVGFILDDSQNEFDPLSPQFGEKYAPPWVPVGLYDWTGRLIGQTYSDQWGRYNALVPSTYTANLPQPSGMSPNMITACMNDSNPAADPLNRHSRQYSTFCYTFQYMPGTTTYLDTPVIPVGAFAGPDAFPLDCEYQNGVPVIKAVNNANDSSGSLGSGPYISAVPGTIYIFSMGNVLVPNPAYCNPLVTTCPAGSDTVNSTIPRDYGFGNSGTASLVAANGTVYPLTVGGWTSDQITATVPATVPGGGASYQLVISSGDNQKSTTTSVTLTVGGPAPIVVRTPEAFDPNDPAGAIQKAIDAAAPNSLITVAPGAYEELVVMWKPVKLQGWGAGSVTISAVKRPAEKLHYWRQRVTGLVGAGAVDLLPSQEVGAAAGLEPVLLFNEEGSGILVLSRNRNPNQGGFGLVGGRPNARIDGFTITGADHAGAVVVNGYAHYLQISNNRIANNLGTFGGGIRVGHATLTTAGQGGALVYQNAFNDHIKIQNNQVIENSSLDGAGGGISLYTGSDLYEVRNNFVCGNFTLGDGGGIGHQGLSNNGLIANNTVIFNESFNQGVTVHGGGILVAGGAALNGPNSLSEGSGTVTINANLILGNAAEAGDGGGIRAQYVNGQDVDQSRNQPNNWYALNIYNNMIVNNVTGLAGGGISLQDALRTNIIHNTIANNDSTATAGTAFAPGSPNRSTEQPAGIVSRGLTPLLFNTIGNSAQARPYKIPYSNPTIANSIIWHNRSFYFFGDPNAVPAVPYHLEQITAGGGYWDLAVLGTATAYSLTPQNSLVTGPGVDPAFVAEYFNGDRGQTIIQPGMTTAIGAPPAFDEGGNFIRLRFGPLTLNRPDTGAPYGDYHVNVGSSALGIGNGALVTAPYLNRDYDNQTRPTVAPDAGADERP